MNKQIRLRKAVSRLAVVALAVAGVATNITIAGATSSSELTPVARINAGAGSYTSSSGATFAADSMFTGGGTYTTKSNVEGTSDPGLYRSERHGMASYNVPVSDGTYVARLHFAEIWHRKAGARVFDVKLEGATAISNLDVYSRVGRNRALVLNFPVAVSDGHLDIEFVRRVDAATLSGIEIFRSSTTATTQPAPAPAEPQVQTRINAGGPAVAGDIPWDADRNAIGGGTYTTTSPIADTSVPALYQSERHGMAGYTTPVPDGSYRVRLHFAEIWHNAPGLRVFDVLIDDSVVASGLDIFARVGKNRPLVIETPVTVTDGTIDVRFVNKVDIAKISGLEILSADATGSTTPATVAAPPATTTITVAPAPTTAGATTFKPAIVPMSAPELVNPSRGLNDWLEGEWLPQPEKSKNPYIRINWKDVEVGEGVYNWSVLDALATKAANNGGKGGFRIMAAHPPMTSALPDYLLTRVNGYYNQGSFYPDFNNAYFLDRMESLFRAIGQRYGNDPRIDLLDIGIYGQWGEWHMGGVAGFAYAAGRSPITAANARRIVDAHVNAMPNKRWIMLWGNDLVADAVKYAMSLRPAGGAIGWRNDCFGFAHMHSVTKSVQWPALQDQWKIAPVVVEHCSTRPGSGSFEAGLEQVVTYHVTLVANANAAASLSSFTQAERDALQLTGKRAGARVQLNELSMPGTVARGSSFDVASNWSNVGVAPAYDRWNLMLQLRDSTGRVVWQDASGLDLRTLVPGTRTVSDSFTVPSTVPAGTYTVTVAAVDAARYLRPLKLAIGDQLADGAYRLGTVAVS